MQGEGAVGCGAEKGRAGHECGRAGRGMPAGVSGASRTRLRKPTGVPDSVSSSGEVEVAAAMRAQIHPGHPGRQGHLGLGVTGSGMTVSVEGMAGVSEWVLVLVLVLVLVSIGLLMFGPSGGSFGAWSVHVQMLNRPYRYMINFQNL